MITFTENNDGVYRSFESVAFGKLPNLSPKVLLLQNKKDLKSLNEPNTCIII